MRVHYANKIAVELAEKERLLKEAQDELVQTKVDLKKHKSWRKMAEIQLAHLRHRAESSV